MQAPAIAFTTPIDEPRWKRWLVHSPLARILAFVVLFVAFVVVAEKTMIAAGWGSHGHAPLWIRAGLAEFLGRALPPLLAYLVLVKGIERRPATELVRNDAGKQALRGLLMGTVLFSAIVGELWLLGSYHVLDFNPHANWLVALLGAGLGAGIGEEIICRGALFRIVEEGLGTWAALVVSALFFGFAHAYNPGATIWSSSAIAIEAGLLFGMLYHLTRSLPVCMGLHASWNFMQGAVYGIPVSGTRPDGLLVSVRTGPHWLSGGAFGAEASVVALLMCSVCTIVLTWMALRRGSIVPPSWRRKPATVQDRPDQGPSTAQAQARPNPF